MMREPFKTQASQRIEQSKQSAQPSNPYDLGGSFQVEDNMVRASEEASFGEERATPLPPEQDWQNASLENQPTNPFMTSTEENTKAILRANLRVLRDKPLEDNREFASFLSPGNLPNSKPMLTSPQTVAHKAGRTMEVKSSNQERANSEIQTMPYRGQFYSRSTRPFVLDPGLIQRWKSLAPQRPTR